MLRNVADSDKTFNAYTGKGCTDELHKQLGCPGSLACALHAMYVNIHLVRRTALQQTLRELGRRGRWCVSEATLRKFLPEPSNTFRTAMTRHVRERAVDRVAPGLYLNPYAQPPAWGLERLATHLRPHDAMYVSLESALHEHGWISQVPSRLTIMTSGRSYTYETPLGTIEFVHTATKPTRWRHRTTFVADRRIHVASPELALEDLRHLRRNLDLVDPALARGPA